MKESWIDFLGWQPKQLKDLQMVAFMYLKQGKYDIAKTFFEALIVLDPKDPYNWQTLGSLKLELKDYTESLASLDKALQLDPHHYPTLLNKAQCLFSLGHLPQAYEIAESLKGCPDIQVAKQAAFLYSLLENVS